MSVESEEEDAYDFFDDALPEIKHRSTLRFKAGSAVWRDNMYTVGTSSRDPEKHQAYLEYQKSNWEEKKAAYNKQRKQQREDAKKDLANYGYIINDGRPKVPRGATMVPKELVEPIKLDELVLIGEPTILEKVDYQIQVPEDLQNYLGVSVINVDVRPLRWGMFRFSAWDELRPGTRASYINGARNALGGDVGYLQDPDNKEKVERFLYWSEAEDKYFLELERKAAHEAQFDEEGNELPPPAPLVKKPSKGKPNFSRNPVRIVEFMRSVNMDPWRVVRMTYEISVSMANSRASALASCCYAYLRYLYKKNDYKNDVFRNVLAWSHIFERYTRVAKKNTGDRHASQLTTEYKKENTVEWPEWRAAALAFIKRFLVISNSAPHHVSVRTRATGFEPWWDGHEKGMRPRIQILEDKDKEHVYKPTKLLPWWEPSYAEKQKDRDSPNLRELRDCTMTAVYSLLAPIRLDWATCEIMSEAKWAEFDAKRKKAEVKEPDAMNIDLLPDQIKESQIKFNINVLVVDNPENPTRCPMAYFGQMKNIKSFKVKPVPKYIREESPLCEQIILAFLRERIKQGFRSDCLFPYSTYSSEVLKAKEKGVKNCFSNAAFGERLADISWDITAKNFTETLMRRSYITWFWQQPGNSPLNTATWDKLLPSVHQNSKDANLGYIKEANLELEEWLKGNAKATVGEREAKRAELSKKALRAEGHDVEANQNPEVDSFDIEEKKFIEDDLVKAKLEIKEVRTELRRSKRLVEAKEPTVAPVIPNVVEKDIQQPIAEAPVIAAAVAPKAAKAAKKAPRLPKAVKVPEPAKVPPEPPKPAMAPVPKASKLVKALVPQKAPQSVIAPAKKAAAVKVVEKSNNKSKKVHQKPVASPEPPPIRRSERRLKRF